MYRGVKIYKGAGSILIVAFLVICTLTLSAQLGIPVESPTQDRLTSLFDKARLYYSQQRTYDALNTAEEALQLAMATDEDTELRILEFIGDVHHGTDRSADGIPFFIRASGIYESKKDSVQLIRLYIKIAEAFRAEEVHSKEQEYYEKLLDILPASSKEERLEVRAKIGAAAYHGENYERAKLTFQSLIPEYVEESRTWLNIHQDLVSTFDAMGQYDSALVYCHILLKAYEKKRDLTSVARLRNNIAYYQTLLNNYEEASENYLAAIDASMQSDADLKDIALMKSNTAVCLTNMGNDREAVSQFNEAIEILENEEQMAEKSRNENMLANVYYETGDLYNAGLFCRRAILSAKQAPEPWREAQAYLTYSNVLRDGNDPVNALIYYEKYLSIRDSIEFARRMKIESLEAKKIQLERQEKALQLRLKEDEVSEMAIRQLRLQNERMEQEAQILMQDRNLALLKEDSLRQSLEIMDQKNLVAQREKEKRLLEQEKQLADLELQKQERLKEAAERDKMLSDQQLQLAQLEAEKQKADKQALIAGVIGAGILSILILASLISSRRKNYLLAKQKEELEQKNEEISAQRDEIEAQRNLVFDQKQEIEAVNDEIVKSIEYAKRLQNAALPGLLTLKEKVDDQFVLFRPRDVVSGDFYWFAEVEGKMVITVADCTGHGVPGAFMSMMGMSLLKELVQKEYITHPGVILRRMRKEIINTMGQKGISGEQRDGMDMALITFNPEERTLDFAGAYNSLYLVRKKDHASPRIEEKELQPDQLNGNHCLYEIPADKMPIAHYDVMNKFKNHELKVMQGDTIYLFTDGFPDQFGGPKGKKFMYKPFKKLLLNISQHPLQKQQELLSETLDEWMGDIAQVDDICVMGLRF